MYSTPVYLYQQIQTVLLIDISGAYFDRRWQPVYAKNLKLNLGVDNVILIQFQNQDQKPVNISGCTFTFRIISQNGEDLLYATELVALSAALGRAKVTVPAADTAYFQAQPASWSLEISSGNLDQAVLVDAYSNARGDIDIVNSVFPTFVASQVLTIPSQAAQNNVFYSSTVTTDGWAMTTFQVDTVGLTGNLTVQGSTGGTANTVEWYNIAFEDLKAGNIANSVSFTNSTERLGFDVEGYHPQLRLAVQIQSGALPTIVYR